MFYDFDLNIFTCKLSTFVNGLNKPRSANVYFKNQKMYNDI